MRNTNKSYLEIKITIIHVVVFLAAVILIGIFLFYLGYQAGRSADSNMLRRSRAEADQPAKHISIENSKAETPTRKKSSIQEEIRLHQLPVSKNSKPVPKKTARIKPKTVTRTAYYTVQVGAFENHAEAKSYSDLFIRKQYPTEIQKVLVKGRTMFRVLVGQYPDKASASQAKGPLEKLAGRRGFFLRRVN